MISLMTSGGVALWVAVLTTPLLIRWLLKNNIGQQIREDGPQVHIAKAGTPTMGGIFIVGAVVIGFLAAHVDPRGALVPRRGTWCCWAIVGAAGIGFADDWIKVRHRRSLGLNKRAKFGARRSALGVSFSLLAVYWAHASTTLSFTRYDSIGLHMGTAVWVVVGHAHHRRGGQRREPDRRPRRPGRRLGDVLLRLPGHHRLLAVPALQPSTTWPTPSTWRWPRWPWPARASASCGGTPRRRRSSWATPGRCRSVPAWPRSAC